MHQGIYRLDKLEEIREGEGELILAESAQEKLVAEWLEQFSIETNTPAPQDSEQQAKETDPTLSECIYGRREKKLLPWSAVPAPLPMVRQ